MFTPTRFITTQPDKPLKFSNGVAFTKINTQFLRNSELRRSKEHFRSRPKRDSSTSTCAFTKTTSILQRSPNAAQSASTLPFTFLSTWTGPSPSQKSCLQKNCFATDQTDPSSETDNWYSLISGMCVSQNDPSIVMMENGVGNNARFKFNMFKWKSRTSYIYMHR